MELLVPHQKSLRQPVHPFETVSEIVNAVDHLLMVLELSLSLDHLLRPSKFYPSFYALKLQIYIFFDHFPFLSSSLLLLNQAFDSFCCPLFKGNHLLLHEGHVEASAEFSRILNEDSLMATVSVRAESEAGFTHCIAAAFAEVGQLFAGVEGAVAVVGMLQLH